ncbi:MAG: HNH endonuclease [Planctomycetia bacterium]|nr:HNH endonuclease [Planctomycetia bacterium]
MSVSGETARLVRQRAADRCEYCLMHQSLQGATFHVEHVVPRAKDGPSTAENLAWSCPGCNLHKSDRTMVVDPQTGSGVPLFNPRNDIWQEHFSIRDFEIVGLTEIGRAAVVSLDFNHARRIQIRKAETLFGLFPP